jgi:ketosteroid isomerase-like protein
MSRENVEAFKRGIDAVNRRDIEALLDVLDPEVEWHPARPPRSPPPLAYRGHEGVREFFRELYEDLAEIHAEYSDSRDLGDRIVVIGNLRTRGKGSGAVTESPIGWLVEFKDGQVIRIDDYLDPTEALEAAGLRE